MEQQSMLGIMAAAAERLSSMHSEASSSPKNHLPPPDAATSSLNNDSSSASHCPSGTATASSCAPSKRPKLILPELTSDLQDDLESTSGKNANHGNIATLSTSTASSTASSSMKVPLSIAKRPQWADYPLRDIIGPPHPHDVLCGRGGGSNNHPGNESFRELVNEVKVPYVNCPKREKPLIARRIVEAVRNQSPPGRFLQKDMDTGLWNDIGDAKAREKTSQALREGAPIIRDLLHAPSSGSDVATALKEAKRANGQGGTSMAAAAAAAGPEASRHSPKGGNAAAHSSPSAKGKNANAKAQDKMTSLSFPPATDTGGGDASGLSHAHPPPHHGALYPSKSLGQPPIPPLPHVRLISNDDQRRGSLPPTKRFHSLGEVDLPMPPSSIASSSSTAAAMDASQPSSSVPSRWSAHFPPSEQGRHLYRNDNLPPPYRTHSFLQPPTQRALHGGGPQGMSLRGIGGGASLAPPYANMHRRSSDYGMYPPPSSLSHSHPHSLPPLPPRYVDSVPIDTVRKLLLGQLDPVQLAMQILPPEDAALVARMRGGDGGALGSGTPSGMMYATASTSLFSSSPGTSSSLPTDAVDETAVYRTRTAPETAPSHSRPDEFAASDAAHVSDDSTSTGSSGGGGGHSKQHSSSSIGSNSHGGSEAGRDDGSAHSSSNEDVPAGRTASSPPSYDWSDSNGSRSTGVGSASAGRDGSPGKDTGGCGRGSHTKKAHAVLPKKKRKFSG
ncbi:hypothetical protein ACHAXS_009482 [Conticribra weissflogii]